MIPDGAVEVIPRKNTKFWIHRILSEYNQKIRDFGEEISILNYQAEHFETMRPEIQDKIITELNQRLEKLEWNYHIAHLERGGDENGKT